MAATNCSHCDGTGLRKVGFVAHVKCPSCVGTGADDAGPSALHAFFHTRDKAPSDRRVRRFHEELWEIASRVEWDADDWKDLYRGLTEVFARIADRHATKADARPVRTHRTRNYEHEDAITDADP